MSAGIDIAFCVAGDEGIHLGTHTVLSNTFTTLLRKSNQDELSVLFFSLYIFLSLTLVVSTTAVPLLLSRPRMYYSPSDEIPAKSLPKIPNSLVEIATGWFNLEIEWRKEEEIRLEETLTLAGRLVSDAAAWCSVCPLHVARSTVRHGVCLYRRFGLCATTTTINARSRSLSVVVQRART